MKHIFTVKYNVFLIFLKKLHNNLFYNSLILTFFKLLKAYLIKLLQFDNFGIYFNIYKFLSKLYGYLGPTLPIWPWASAILFRMTSKRDIHHLAYALSNHPWVWV